MSSRLPSLSPTHFSLFNEATVQDIPPSARSMPARFLAETAEGLFTSINQQPSAYDTGRIKRPRMTTTDGDLPENVSSAKITPQLFRRNACPDVISHFNLPPNTSCTLCQVNPPQAPVEIKETPVSKPRPKPMISDMPQEGAQLQPRTLVCPPTPRPFKLRTRQELCPFVSAALKIIDEGKIEKAGQTFFLEKMREMQGEHCQLYALSGDSQIVTDVDNRSILIKTFHKDLMLSENRRIENEFLKNSLKQYDEMQLTHLPTVKIYNRDTAMQDGYLIVERLASLRLPWNVSSKRGDLSGDEVRLLEEIKAFVSFAFQSESSLPLDLHDKNLGIKESGRVALLDFMERDEGERCAFGYIAKKCLLSLSNGNKEIYEEMRLFALQSSSELYINLELI